MSDRVRVLFHATVRHPAGRVVWSPDGRWVAAGIGAATPTADPNGLTVLDAAAPGIRWQVNGYMCLDIAVSPDARRIATSTFQDGDPRPQRLRMLDADTGAEIWQARGFGRLAFSPDGSLLGVIGTTSDTRRDLSSTFVLDAGTGTLLHAQGRRLSNLSTPMFSADSRLMCTGSPALVDSRTGAVVWQRAEHEGFASASAFTAAGDGVLVASGRFGTIAVYDLVPAAGGAAVERSRIEVANLSMASTQVVDSIRFSPDRRTVAFIAEDHVGLSTVASGRPVFLHQVNRAPGKNSMSFRADGEELVVNRAVLPSPPGLPTQVQGLVVVDTTTGTPVWGDAGRTIAGLAYGGDGSRVVAGGRDFVRVYEVGRPELSRHDCGGPVSMVAVSEGAAGVLAAVVAGDEPALTVFRARGGEVLLRRVHAGTITSVAVSPDGHSVATASADGRCRLFDTLTVARWAARHGGPVNAVAFSADGRSLATASSDRSARLFDRELPAGADTEDHQPRWAQRHAHSVTHIALGPDLAWVATVALDRKVRILAPTTGEELHTFDHDARIRALSASATGVLASASEDGSASVIDAATGQRRFRIEHPTPLNLAALSADGALLATAGTGAEVHIWRVDGAEPVPLHRLDARAVVTALAFDPVDHRLAIATEDPVVQVVDAVAGTGTDRLIHPGPVHHLAFGIDGALLATGCADHHARGYEMRRA